jgi:hypothetical protein
MLVKRRIDWTYLLLCPYVIVTYIPSLARAVQLRYTGPWVVLWVWVAVMQSQNRKLPLKVKTSFLGALLFLIMNTTLSLVFRLFDHSDGMSLIAVADIARILLPLLIVHYSVVNNRLQELGWLTLVWLFALACTGAATIRGEAILEGGARLLTAGGGENLSDAVEAVTLGVGQYTHVYSMGLLIAPLLYCSHFMSMRNKLICWAVSAVFLITVYVASFSICVIGVTAGLLILFMLRLGITARAVKVIGCLMVVLNIVFLTQPQSVSFMTPVLDGLKNVTDIKQYQHKIDAVLNSIQGVGSEVDERFGLYLRSWNAFLEHPFVGVGQWSYSGTERDRHAGVGGHSEILDLLGSSGLLGFTIYILRLFFLFRYLHVISAVALGFRWWPAVYCFMFPAAIVACINPLNGFMIWTDILVIIPGLACLFKTPHAGMMMRAGQDPRLAGGAAQRGAWASPDGRQHLRP